MSKFKLAVITPASRGLDCIQQLVRDMINQTLPKNLWQHVLAYDGYPATDDVVECLDEAKRKYNLHWYPCTVGATDPKHAPGTSLRNHATEICDADYVCFADDDDRYRDDYLSGLMANTKDNHIGCVQMSLSDAQAYRGSASHVVLAPEVGSTFIPRPCHYGTPCLVFKKEWAMAHPWLDCTDHDFVFAHTIVNVYKPIIHLEPGMRVDVRGQVIGKLKDWVTVPPFYRGK